jgi:hypothetical protein
VAARTIPFPHPPGIAATQTPYSLPSSPGVAKVSGTSRRYRGLQLIAHGERLSGPPRLESLEQTRAIVAQVSREVAQQAARGVGAAKPALVSSRPSQPSRTGGFVRSLLHNSL